MVVYEYQDGHPSFEDMKRLMANGIVLTGYKSGEAVLLLKDRTSAFQFADAMTECGDEKGVVRQFIYNLDSMEVVGNQRGVAIKPGQTLIPVPSEQASLYGIYFRMPSEHAKRVLKDLIDRGKVMHYDDTAVAEKVRALATGRGNGIQGP